MPILRKLGSLTSTRCSFLFLLIGLIQGLVYLFLIPPWQHYDEPTHFEYAALIAQNRKLPVSGDESSGMRRSIAASMIENDFFMRQDFQPNLLSTNETIWLGLSQLGDLPVYYIASAMALLPVQGMEVEHLLYVARFVSLAFYLATLLIAYLIVREVTRPKSALRFLVPLVIALQPAFADLMTSVNNDVGATLAFSAFLWMGVRILKKGLKLGRLLALVATLLLCLLTKTTAWAALPLGVLIFFILLLPKIGWQLPVILLSSIASAGLLVILSSDPASWYRTNPYSIAKAVDNPHLAGLPIGNPALGIWPSTQNGFWPSVFQPLDPSVVRRLRGRTVTLGAWIWTDNSALGYTPVIWTDGIMTRDEIELTSTPSFFAFHSQIPHSTEQIQINLLPAKGQDGKPVVVFYDGLALVIGKRPLDQYPESSTPGGQSGIWAGIPFNNLIRNPSFEERWLVLKPSVDFRLMELANVSFYQTLAGFQDYRTHSGYFRLAIINLFQSFWARFSWNQIRLASPWYYALALITGLGGLGALHGAWRTLRELPQANYLVIIWLLASVIGVWAGALFRVDLPFWGNRGFIPGARYAYPAIIPTMLVLTWGWERFFGFLMPRRVVIGVLLLFFLSLDIISVWTIIEHFR